MQKSSTLIKGPEQKVCLKSSWGGGGGVNTVSDQIVIFPFATPSNENVE